MSVIPITIFFSLLLVFLFVGLFWREQRARRFGSMERDSLLPLAEERPHACGCDHGLRPPCAGCLRRRESAAPAPACEGDDLYF
jgi:hypothetical protein